MEIVADDAANAFVMVANELIRDPKMYCLSLQFLATEKETARDRAVASAFDHAFGDKSKQKGNEILPWRQWLINSGFPQRIYLEHDRDLMATIEDPRISEQNFQAKVSNHNFFGRMCRPLPQHGVKTYMHYLLERWRNKQQRSQPNFYFDIEPMEWVWDELIKHPKQIKTGRSGATCATNMSFRWDTVNDRPIITWILKHCYFSHLYQDIYSPQLIIRAICKELGIECNALISVFFISIFMDERKIANKLLDNLE
jgi:hypothetical protein